MQQKLKLKLQALLGGIIKKLLGKYVYALVTKTNNGLFAVDPEDYGVGKHLRQEGNYGEDELVRLRPFINSQSSVLVVGSHIGSLVIPLAKACKKITAIEANPATYELLELNLALNKVSNCQAYNLAANDQKGTMELLASRSNSGGSKRVPQKKDYAYYYDNPQTIKVPAVRLDDQLAEKQYDLIVMDIEGSEYFALKGMPEILKQAKVLVVEYLPHHLKKVSGVTVDQFLGLIEPHFSRLTVPSRGLKVEGKGIRGVLQEMYDRDQEDNGIIFER